MEDKKTFLKVVEWSNEDDCFIGSVPGWIGKCCHGKNEIEVFIQLTEILSEWIEIYKKEKLPLPLGLQKKSYSGRFQLRIDKQLHRVLDICAKNENVSLNSYCLNALKEKVNHYLR